MTPAAAYKPFRRFRLFSGYRGEIQAAAVEVDRVDEVLLVAEAAGRVLHPLDLGVDRLTCRVGDAMLEIGDDVGERRLSMPSTSIYRLMAISFPHPGTGRLQFGLA